MRDLDARARALCISPAGWTMLWGWGTEQTVWLRWCFTTIERLPAQSALPEPMLDHRPRWARS